MRRLHELGDVCALIVQFGPFKGSTLAQIAMRQPDYIRQLAARAQRPDVRVAAGRVVEALQEVPDEKRSGTRRSAATRTTSSVVDMILAAVIRSPDGCPQRPSAIDTANQVTTAG